MGLHDARRLLTACLRRGRYTAVPHVWDSETTVHIFRPLLRGRRWYVKAYFIHDGDSRVVLISVHS